MAASTVLYEPSNEGIATITINRPAVRNAVNHATSLKLAEAFQDFENDASQRVCIFTGAGTNFCAGYDLHEVAGSSTGEVAVGRVDRVNGALGPMGPSRMQLSKPVIAAISGHAVAGGLELSLLADLRVADTTAVFGVFCRRFGVPLIDGGTADLVSAHYSAHDASSLEDALRFEFERGALVVAEESVQGAKRFGKGAGRGGKFEKGKL
ncbi:hypothetical protein LLEC1_04787 [Akanthomyces lecanii]|uniref:3-hydroxyisobutyryl-coenzyme A hydrolase n=1 Tax=Cordyceps confragosa TaxID=2714763 RepID=A0A179II19_CORDF|nr:hypothetical protein LLEC1_04787 [Akanthomyces lecanii]